MSVLAVITDEKEALAFTRWGFQLARAKQTPLVLIKADEKNVDYYAADIDLSKGSKDPIIELMKKTLEDEVRIAEDISANPHFEYHDEETISEHTLNIPGYSIKAVKGRTLKTPVLKLVDTDKASLLLLGRHEPHKGKAHFTDYLYSRVHCSTMVIRLGNAEFKRCSNLLMPMAGGPHGQAALKEGSLLSEAQGTKITPLLIETEGEYSEEVGKEQLNGILKQSGVQESTFITPRVEVTEHVVEGITEVAKEGFDLVVVGASEKGNVRKKLFGALPSSLMKADPSLSIAIFRSQKSFSAQLADKFEYWCNLTIPQLSREDRINLYNNLHVNSNWNFDFISLICLSTAIASLGLISNSTAVVIGAMLIAPLMVPILAAGLALVQGNLPLIFNSVKSIVLGFLSALLIGFLCGIMSPLEDLTSEILARGEPKIPDLLIALFSGIAAAHCLSRPKLSAALPGVAIAAALVPPIASTGISISRFTMVGLNNAGGAALLFFTNVVCIILGAAICFYSAGIRQQKQQQNTWAKRVIISLILTSVLLLPLLGTHFLKKVKDTKHLEVDEVQKLFWPTIRRFEPLDEIKVRYHRDDKMPDELILDVHLEVKSVKHIPNSKIAQKLSDIISEEIKQQVKVRIRPQVIVQH
ncbi:MAG: TIGR00341 family protein [Lentisphaerales bacterium]|nr:TIGR00341 family protein [Lentisphaerales bacterium]